MQETLAQVFGFAEQDERRCDDPIKCVPIVLHSSKRPPEVRGNRAGRQVERTAISPSSRRCRDERQRREQGRSRTVLRKTTGR